MSDKLYSCFKSSLSLHTNQQVVVAYSGGLDSSVLLHLAARLRAELPQLDVGAVHIHHGLSPNADDWLRHCQAQCQALALPFVSQRVNLASGSRQSLEALARDARYQAITALTKEDTVVLLGQHQDDQLETVLLQLKRGAGPKGLAAMAQVQQRLGRTYLRPLLSHRREELEAYANLYGLRWIEDESNLDQGFERNFLRHAVIPSLKQRWPAITQTVSRSARLCAEQQQLLEEVSKERLQTVQVGADYLDIQALQKFSKAWQQQLVRLWLQEAQVQAPPEQLLQRLDRELFDAREDGQPCLSWGEWQFRRFRQRLYLLKRNLGEKNTPKVWLGQSSLLLEDGRQLLFIRDPDAEDLPKLYLLPGQQVQICFNELSHPFCPAGEKHHKPLKQWFKQADIPPWQRQAMPLVLIDGKLAAVVGWTVDRDFCQPSTGTTAWRLELAG
ncbi:tRNA lysidine(34) synthetase TilS [Bowmanella pacifica]|uniref:tRNA(Ile)-lysidine synthase n=1 Tax=Bowmanella pacifica TaxID=502051 RepID=A0A917Z1Y0_9ALTE|nr:tRNA lysidine(34) synthetase TilS [Bowmanella pacifica]GGO72129.1 tRNA(Ile)-lysidine synthase [Bowmanella pacifica]